MGDEDWYERFFLRATIGLWVMWALGLALWLAVSTYVYVVHHDAGSFIGGGVVMVLWTAVIVALQAVRPRRDRDEVPR